MASALVGGAALGAAFQQLFKVILKLGEQAINFNPVLKDIKSKVHSIIPLIREIEELNEVLDYPIEETEKLRNLIEDGKQLLLQCEDAKLGKLSYLKRPIYTEKLRELDASIRSFMDSLLLQMARDQKKNLKLMNQLMEIICRLDSNFALTKPAVDFFVSPCLVPELLEDIVGLEKSVEELKVKLLKDEVKMLIVTAPGGCGKTTLALKFCHDKQVKDKFQKSILFLSVSSKPDVKLVLKDTIQSLRGVEVPDFQNDEHAFWYLELWLRQTSRNPVLIVLDDVWEGPESEYLLEKFFRMSNCKMLVTSRYKFLKFGEPYDLEPLNYHHARELFHRSASLENITPRFPDEEIVEKIVKGCKRFPLALKFVARLLSGRAASVWKVMERKWSRGGSILGSETELLECLKSSLDVVPDEKAVIKKTFMDLGSFPEDQKIRVATFIDMCRVLYEVDECEAMSILDELSIRTLVNSIAMRNESYDDDCHSESYFTQHDILRELAIHLSNKDPICQRTRLLLDINRNDFPTWWSEKPTQLTNARLLSITTDEMFSSCWPDMEAPEVEVLVLNLRSKTYNCPEFMKTMNKLKALLITNYGFSATELISDYQLINCLPRLERIRLERVSVTHFCNNESLKPLVNLQKISLFMCKIGRGFMNCPTRISDLLPNLLEISIDFCSDLVALPAGLYEIVNLEKLSITNCHGLSSLPEELGKLRNLKTLRLRSCIHLEELPDSTAKLGELVVLDISHCVGIAKLPEKIGELQKLEKLNVWSCSSLLKVPPSLRNLKNLKAVVCGRETAKWLKVVSPRHVHLVKEQKEDINLDWL